jgi:hypothetical protein
MTKIDQMDRYAKPIARVFNVEGAVCFVAVHHGHEGDEGPGLGIAVANQQGFRPVPKFYYAAETHDEAEERADQLNRDVLNLTDETAMLIQTSTMGGQRFGH